MPVRAIQIEGKTLYFVADDLGMPVSFGYETETKADEVAALIESSDGLATIPDGVDVEAAIANQPSPTGKPVSYTLEFNGSGEVSEGYFANDAAAQAWAKSVLENRGFDQEQLVFGDWDADGQNDDGEQCWRMLCWANEVDAKDDPGMNAVCKLCKGSN